jgi:hypothetical protein
MDINNIKGLIEAYQQVNAPQEVDEAKQPFPAKKVAKQMAKAKAGSVYGRPASKDAVPNVSDSEKKETSRYSKMFHASEKAKREKQNADKARRSPTFYKDTHPASAPKMKKANEEFDIFDLVLEFLQAEGFAETLEEAKWMMANMIDEEIVDAILDEAITSEKGKAKAAEMIAKRSTPSGRAKAGQGANVALIKHIGRSNRDGLGGTPPNRKVAGSNWPKSYSGIGGTGNKAARRAGTYKD